MTTCYRCQNGEPHHLIERGPVTLAICADCLRSTDISYRDICARCFREPAISPIISEATGTVYFFCFKCMIFYLRTRRIT